MEALTQSGLAAARPARVHRAGLAAALLLLTLLGLGLRLLSLNLQPLWWDEGYSVWFATHPLPALAALTAGDIHPPLYYALLRGWIAGLGPGPVALRLFSVFAGTLAIPLAYVAGRRLLGVRVAWLAAFLVAISPLHIYYSQEVRMYGLAMLLGLALLPVAWEVLEGSGGAGEQGGRGAEERRGRGAEGDVMLRRRSAEASRGEERDPSLEVSRGESVGADPLRVTVEPLGGSPAEACTPRGPAWLLYILLATAALYTLYYAALIPIGLTVYALLRVFGGPREGRLPGRTLRQWLGAQAAVALLYLPWILYAAPRLAPYVSQKIIADADRPLGPLAYLGRHLSAFLTGHLEGPFAPYWPFALLLLLPLGIGLYWFWQDAERGGRVRRALLMLGVVLGCGLALGWAIALRFPFFPPRGERLLLILLPSFLMLAAAGADGLLRSHRAAGTAAMGLWGAMIAVSLAGFYTVPRYPEDDYRRLIARTVEQGLPGDTVFAVYPWQVGYWRSYGRPDGPTAELNPDGTWGAPVMAALDEALARGRVWFPAHLALGGLLESRIEAYLAYRGVPFVNEWFGAGTRLSAWGDAPADETLAFAPVRFALRGGGAVELSGVRAARDPVPAGNTLTGLALQWRAEAEPPPLAVSVRLTDALGQIWAQHDYEPLGGLGLAAWPDEPRCATCTGQKDAPVGPWTEEDALGLLIPAGTPPGEYHVEVVVRPADDERPLEASTADGATIGTSVPLTTLEVVVSEVALGPERLPIAARAAVDLADGVRFLGHTAGDAPAAPGDLRKVSLFWQAETQPPEDAVAFLQLLDGKGGVVAGWEAPPGAAYPTSAWEPGTLIRTQAALRIPAGSQDGRYRLIAGLYRATDRSRVATADGADRLSLGTVTVKNREHEMTAPQPGYAADATFGGVARLIGYDLSAESVAPGETLPLVLHWQALGATERPYTVFVHLVDEAGTIRGYGDAEPGGGQFPTAGWLAGEYLADAHTVTVAADAPPGVYRLEVGLYDPATGQRLLTADGADHVVLDAGGEVRSGE